MKQSPIVWLIAGTLAAPLASAGLVGVTDIRVTSALPTYLQISEVSALKTGTGVDLAEASAGAVATTGNLILGTSGPENAIDGIGPSAYPNLFHSLTDGAGEYLNIALANPSELDSLTIFGRSDCCDWRDVFDVTLLGAGGAVLASFSDLDASGPNHFVTVKLPDTSTGVPDGLGAPAAFMTLAGVCFMRRMKAVAAGAR
jgi:hypothetical protein